MHHAFNLKSDVHFVDPVRILPFFRGHHILVHAIQIISFVNSVNKIAFSEDDDFRENQHVGFLIVGKMIVSFIFYLFLSPG